MSLSAGLLRHRITIEEPTDGVDARGGITQSWATFATRWASLRPLTGRERFVRDEREATADMEFRLRYTAGVTAKMRVNFGGRLFDIQQVVNEQERKAITRLITQETV